MWLHDTPQDHNTWQYTLGLCVRHAGPSTSTSCCTFTCHSPFDSLSNNIFEAINLFILSADQLYGPITTLRRDGRLFKKLPWTAFSLSDGDWARVLDAKAILAVSVHLSTTAIYASEVY